MMASLFLQHGIRCIWANVVEGKERAYILGFHQNMVLDTH